MWSIIRHIRNHKIQNGCQNDWNIPFLMSIGHITMILTSVTSLMRTITKMIQFVSTHDLQFNLLVKLRIQDGCHNASDMVQMDLFQLLLVKMPWFLFLIGLSNCFEVDLSSFRCKYPTQYASEKYTLSLLVLWFKMADIFYFGKTTI